MCTWQEQFISITYCFSTHAFLLQELFEKERTAKDRLSDRLNKTNDRLRYDVTFMTLYEFKQLLMLILVPPTRKRYLE